MAVLQEAPKPRLIVRAKPQGRSMTLAMRLGIGVGGLILVLVILGIPLYGYYLQRVVPGQEPVVVVNDTTITMDSYVRRLRLSRLLLESRGSQPGEFASAPMQLVFDLVDDELIKQGARELGITLTPEEISEHKVALSGQGVSGEQWADVAENRAWGAKLKKYLASRVPEVAEQVQAQVILLDSEAKAKEVVERLQRGEAFAPLARELSHDGRIREKGGDLGWIPRGIVKGDRFDETVFALAPGSLSGPIDTPEGYYVVKVLAKEVARPVAEERLKELRDGALERWLRRQKETNKVELYWNSEKYAWANEQIRR